MKQIFTLLILLTFSLSSSAQILAGQHLSEYTDIIPDTLIRGICHSANAEEIYSIGNNLEIKSYCSTSPSHTTQYTSITPLNPNTYIRLGRIDSVYNTYGSYWMVAKVPKQFYDGDTINSIDADWNNEIQYLIKQSSGFNTTTQSVIDWAGTGDKYIGIKYQHTTDTVYGWIRLSWENGALLKDFSSGSQTLSINDIELAGVSIYPNPTNDIITVEGSFINEEVQLQLTDVLGREIKTGVLTNTKVTIDVSDVQDGIYYLILQTTNTTATKKIIVQRR